jgi:hypothetical protein
VTPVHPFFKVANLMEFIQQDVFDVFVLEKPGKNWCAKYARENFLYGTSCMENIPTPDLEMRNFE